MLIKYGKSFVLSRILSSLIVFVAARFGKFKFYPRPDEQNDFLILENCAVEKSFFQVLLWSSRFVALAAIRGTFSVFLRFYFYQTKRTHRDKKVDIRK